MSDAGTGKYMIVSPLNEPVSRQWKQPVKVSVCSVYLANSDVELMQKGIY